MNAANTDAEAPLRVLVVGAGHMGTSHALAFDAIPDFEVCGIVTRGESGARLAARSAVS
jgi:predicted homoserine dehydrogenase-like protein